MILLDLALPDMDGLQVAQLIKERARTRHVPIIFLTGTGGADRASLAYATGAVDYLEKPVRPEVVRAKVASLAQLHRHAAELRAAVSRAGAQALRRVEERSRRRYRSLAEAIPQIVWTAGPDGSVDYLSGRFAAFTGLPAQDGLGWGWVAAIHHEDTSAILERWRAAVLDPQPFQGEARLRGRDGTFRWHLWRAEPERDEDEEVAAWLGTATDIEDLKEAQAAERRAVALRDEFLSVASHELRTPLTALGLSLQVLRTLLERADALSAPGVGERLDALERQAERLTRLVNQLLDVTRVEGGQLGLQLEPCDLVEIVREALARVEPEADRAGCALEVALVASLRGSWDRLSLDRVVTNLLANALKYGAGRPVRIALERAGELARLEVQDHGIGISPEDQARIFERFTRAVSWRSFGGLGLGLYIARKAVLAHGGELRVSSRPGEGATFTVELPIRAAEERTLAQAALEHGSAP